IHLPLSEKTFAFLSRVRDEVDVLARVESDVRHHASQVDVLPVPEFGDRNAFPLEIPNRTNPVRPEQLEAADVISGQHGDGITKVHLDDELPGEIETDVNTTRSQ